MTLTQRTDAQRQVREVPATVGRRLLAFLLDAVLVSLLVTVVDLILDAVIGPAFSFGTDPGVLSGAVFRHPDRVIVDSLAGIAVGACYFVASWLLSAATPGQRVFAITVRPSAGRNDLAFGQVLLRYLALGIWVTPALPLVTSRPALLAAGWAIALIWYAALLVTTVRSPERRGLHDRLAGTAVKGRPNRAENRIGK